MCVQMYVSRRYKSQQDIVVEHPATLETKLLITERSSSRQRSCIEARLQTTEEPAQGTAAVHAITLLVEQVTQSRLRC
jgi:hypothetical protein